MKQFVLFIGNHHWRLAVVDSDGAHLTTLPETPDGTLSDRVAEVRKHLAAAGHTRAPLLLVIPSSWCLQAIIPNAHLGRGDRRSTLAYRLEEDLPLAAEDFVADFRQRHDGAVWGVCVDIAPLRPVVDALSAAGLCIRHICPLGMLAAATIAAGHPDARAICIKSPDDSLEFVELHHALPINSAWFADCGPAFARHLDQWQHTSNAPSLHVMGDVPHSADLAARLTLHATTDMSADQAAATQAARILRGDEWPWIDFRRDALALPNPLEMYRRPIAAAVTALVLFLICIILATQLRGRRYAQIAEREQQQQIALFKQVFPGQHAPSSVRARLSAEQRRLAALLGRPGADDSRGQLTAPSTLLRWRDFLQGLPADQRFQILDMNIQRDLFRIEGQAPSHVEADRLVSALRQAGQFDVDAPKTEALKEGGVSFTFVAHPPKPAAATGESP